MSSEKRGTTPEVGGEGDTFTMGTVTVVKGDYWGRPVHLEVSIRAAKALKVIDIQHAQRLYVYDTLLGWPQ